MPLMLLCGISTAGHRAIVLMGGGTGLIGDPSGKQSERPPFRGAIRENVRRQRDSWCACSTSTAKETRALVLNKR